MHLRTLFWLLGNAHQSMRRNNKMSMMWYQIPTQKTQSLNIVERHHTLIKKDFTIKTSKTKKLVKITTNTTFSRHIQTLKTFTKRSSINQASFNRTYHHITPVRKSNQEETQVKMTSCQAYKLEKGRNCLIEGNWLNKTTQKILSLMDLSI